MAIVFPAMVMAQSVSINTDASAPHQSAMLDIKSDSKGLLMPRLTTLQRTSIAGPATGLTVFDMDTYSYWMYRGDINGGWVELMNSIDKHWNKTGTHVFNANTGNIGIGTSTPASKLTINDINPVIGMLNNGMAVGHIQADGFDMKIGTHPDNPVGDIIFQPKGIDRITISESGKLGIGTSAPTALLSINSSNNGQARLDFHENNVIKSYINSSAGNLTLGTDFNNAAGTIRFQTGNNNRMTIDPSGQVGIGTSSPSSILTISSNDPKIQLKDGITDVGFVQLVNDDIKMGTNANNSTGSFIVSTKGVDRLAVTHNGNVGIGTLSSFYKLEVNGTSKFTDDMRLDGELYTKNIELSASNAAPQVKLIRSGNLITTGYLNIDDDNHLKLSKNFNGGGIIIDANTSSGTKRFYASKANQFNFGTGLTPVGYTVSVEGKVIATDFTTSAIANWPDYVFADNYELKPLAQVKKFISENKHLPNIPPAKEIEKGGVHLGDMSKRLMEKVEELTLYIINLQEQIDALKKNK